MDNRHYYIAEIEDRGLSIEDRALKMAMDNIDKVKIKKDGKWVYVPSPSALREREQQEQQEQQEELEPLPQSSLPGISFRRDTQRWALRMTINGERKRLGAYKTLEECVEAWVVANNYRKLLEGLK